jgi:uncharacterized protein YifN (PemK superfamily)
MPLLYQPKAGSVVMCDFAGFVVPEMIKVRPVVILARSPSNSRLVTVIPLSTTAPTYHHELSATPLPGKGRPTCWAKCDMVATVSLARLDRYKAGRDRFTVPKLPPADFAAIQRGCARPRSDPYTERSLTGLARLSLGIAGAAKAMTSPPFP